MADAELAAEFPWLKVDPAPILGDPRPRTIKELLGKSKLWLDLYRSWLGTYDASYVEGLKFVTGVEARLTDYTARFEQTYPAFYKAAGELKEAARRNPGSIAQRFPWAPRDPHALLGDARPRTFEMLAAFGTQGSWTGTYQRWLAHHPPFEDAEAWLDWVFNKGGSEQWEHALNPTVEAFAKDIGRLKDRLRKLHAEKAKRAAHKAAEEKKAHPKKAEPHKEAAKKAEPAKEAAKKVAPPAAKAAAPAAPAADAHAAPAKAQAPAAAPPAKAAAAPAADAAHAAPAKAAAAKMAPAAATHAAAPDHKAAEHHSEVPQHARAQLQMANPLLTQAPRLSDLAGWLAGRFGGFGGMLAQEANTFAAYKDVLEADINNLNFHMQSLADQLTKSSDDILFELLACMRSAVYRLAWDADLTYPTYYGGWPHFRVWHVMQTVADSGSARLQHQAGRALQRLIEDVNSFYDVLTAMLDTALTLVMTKPPGYHVDDGAVPWGVHQVAAVTADIGGLRTLAGQWAAQDPMFEEDLSIAEAGAQHAFGMPYEYVCQAG